MRREEAPLQKHTLQLYQGDFEELQSLYEVGASYIIRRLVREHLRQYAIQKAAQIKLNIEEIDL